MNYITSCPTCETQFLLNTDHLKAYRGKVQCGNCNHVFNAKNRLTEVSDDIPSTGEYSTAEYNLGIETQSDTDIADSQHDEVIELVSRFADDEPSATVDEKPTEQKTSDEKPTEEKLISEVLNVVLETVPDLSDLTIPSEFAADEKSNNPYISDDIPQSIAEEDIDIDTVRAPILIEDLSTDPKFQAAKPKRIGWLLLLAVLLLLLVILQSIYFSRAKIAADYPQFKPYLVQACAQLHCKINLPQQVDLLTIDDSDMQESDDYQDVIHFSSLLINNANHVQAYPNIELTLTDIDDKPVLRKLVKPEEYLKLGNDIANGLAGREEVRINLAINVHALSVAGYRVLLTY